MSSFISAAPVASGQVQSLDGLRAHSLPSDAMIMASSSLVTPTNQNTGSYALVESANALTLTTTGSVPVVTQSPFADLYKEGSLYFSGSTGNYVSATATGLAGTQWNTTGLTVEAWVNYTTFAGASVAYTSGLIEPTLVGLMSATGSGASSPFSNVSFGVNTTGNVLFWYSTTAVGQYTVTSYTQLSTNTWNHIAVSIAPAGFVYLFVNGVQSQIQENRNGTPIGAFFYGVVQGTPTATSSNPLVIGQFNQVAGTVYVADLRITTGAGIYTGSTGSYATFTVPSAPLSTAATGVTQALIRAGQNSPTIQSGALTFDRGLKQFMNFGPQTFNIATRGFTAVWRGQFTGTPGSYERLFALGVFGTNGIIEALRFGTSTNIYWIINPSNATSGGGQLFSSSAYTQGTVYTLVFRYNPVTQIMDLWTNGVQTGSTTLAPATLVADRILNSTTLGAYSGAGGSASLVSNTFAIYNRALSNVEIYNSYLALTTTPATPLQKTLEIGDINGTPALSVAGDGKVFMDSVGLTSNVVPWPPAAMTGYDTVINGGVYKARASTEFSTAGSGYPYAWYAFDKNTSNYWVSVGAGYNTSSPYNYTGTVTTTDLNGTVYPGEWLQVQLPSPITLSNYTGVFSSYGSAAPSTWVILGSRDGVNWTLVDSRAGQSYSSATQTFTLSTAPVQSFNYFRFVTRNVTGTGGYVQIYELYYYGTADTSPALTIAPATTFNTSVATPSLVGVVNNASFVPQDFSSSGLNIPAYVVSNTTTVANTVAFTSFGPFAGEGSLYFPGGWGAGVTFQSSVTSLNYDFFATDNTIEMWIYFQKLNQGNILGRMPTSSYGTGGGTYEWILYATSSNYPSLVWNGTGTTSVTSSTAFVAQTWNHLAVVNSGTSVLLFLNGALVGSATKTTTTYNSASLVNLGAPGNNTGASGSVLNTNIACVRFIRGSAVYTAAFTPSTQPLTAIQGTTQAGLPYGTVLLLRNAPAPGRIQTTKFSGANSVGLGGAPQVLSFPPAAMTGYSTALSSGYGQGTYVASASNEFDSGSNTLWRAFDKSTSTLWTGDGSSYTSGNYVKSPPVTTVDVNGTSYQGEWIQLQMPSSIVLSSYAINAPGSQGPSLFYLLGSRDGVNWSLVDQRSGQVPVSTWQTYTVSATQSFTYFRLVTNKISGGSSYVQIFEIVLNGSIESVNVTADGRVGLGVVNPTRALEVAGDVVCGGTLSAGNPLMFRNAIINGDMRINQRGISTNWASPTAAGTTAGGIFGCDRWSIYRGSYATGAVVAQLSLAVTDAPYLDGIQFYQRVGRTSGNSGTQLLVCDYNLESRDSYRFVGQSVTYSFWYRTGTGLSGTLAPGFYGGTATDEAARNGLTGFTTFASLNLPVSNTWRKASMTGFVNNNFTQVVVNFAYVPSGTAGGFDYFDVTGVQLEKGTVATPFEVRPYATELALCQRYYYTAYVDTVLATYGTSAYANFIYYKVPMRTTVIPVFYTSFFYPTTGGAGTTVTPTVYGNTTEGFGFYLVVTTYSWGVIGFTANAEL